MGVLKSLGLSPAKRASSATSKAFRRLLGRVLPAGDDDGAPGSLGNLSQESENNHRERTGNQNKVTNNPGLPVQNGDEIERGALDPLDKARPALIPQVKEMPKEPEAKPDAITTTETMALNQGQDKENHPPNTVALSSSLAHLDLNGDDAVLVNKTALPQNLNIQDPKMVVERAMHMKFTDEALDMARLALKTNETPVGCVIVHNGNVIARGMNATNVTRNGTRHAEFMALAALLSYPREDGPRTTCLKPNVDITPSHEASDTSSVESHPLDEGNEDGSKGHLYPYGQKLHPAPQVDRAIIQESILYVTVEPCVMCASLLRQLGIKKVYFGAVNDKFGGTGGVFSIHANSLPVSSDGQTASAHPTLAPAQLPDGSGTLGVSFPLGGGDGGNIEAGYEIEGGWGRDEAVALLRRFYVQENGRAPVPRKKEGRAARLAAMMEQDGDTQLDVVANDPAQDKVQVDLPTSAHILGDKVNITNRKLETEECGK